MTTFEYNTLIIPVNYLHSLEDFIELVREREDGWKEGMLNLLKVCENSQLYEYCAIIKKELDKEQGIL